MSTDLVFGLVATGAIVYYLLWIRVGLRVGQGKKWPLGSEATVALSLLLILQWLVLAVWIWISPSEEQKVQLAQIAIPVLILIPGILLLAWGWLRNKVSES